MKTVRVLAVSALAAIALAGCGMSVPGSPVAGELDVRALDIGAYSDQPLEFRSEFRHSLDAGTELAIIRLAGHVALGSEIKVPVQVGAGVSIPVPLVGGGMSVLREPGDYESSVAQDQFRAVLQRDGMLFGFGADSADRSEPNAHAVAGDTALSLTVFQFPDDASAAAAAGDLEAVDFAAAPGNVPVQLAKYPAAKAHWRPDIRTMGARIAHGSYVVDLFARTPQPDLAALTALSATALDVQLPLLDSLKPLSRRDVLHLDYDPDGLMRRTLKVSPDPNPDFDPKTTVPEGDMDPRALLHRLPEPAATKALLAADGVDRVALSGSTVLMRARDEAAAASLWKSLNATAPKDVQTPPGLSSAGCGENTDAGPTGKRYTCRVRYRRYVATVSSDQLGDVQQRASAQYALLANAQ
ncbi:hypothetical protein ABIA39_004409 [Nocardia sp. GAS34]|uniref:DUF7373 family lipoprotein n=1 Tax=unclassified Nocardia TaxID=2637762 RepID=UPI003D1E562D